MADKRSFETTIHDVVYSVDTGAGLRIIRVALYVLVLLIMVMVYTATQFRGLNSEEAMDYAQLGRNMSLRNGMLTKVVRPLTMWKMQTLTPGENPMIGAHPDLFNAPAYPALLATGFKIFDLVGVDPFTMPEGVRGVAMPAEQWIILPLNHIFALLSGLLVYFMGKRLFSKEIGFVSMTTYYLSNLVWQNSISGLNITMAGFFVLSSFFCMITATLNRRDNRSKALWLTPYLLSIVCAAIAFYTRFITIAVVPGVCLLAWLMCGRFRGGTRFVVVFVILFTLLITPWVYRNYKISGNPAAMLGYAALTETPAYPGNSLHRDYHPEVSFGRSINILKAKWVDNYSGKYSAVVPSMGGGILMGLFIATFFYHFVRPQVNYLRWGVGVSLLTAVVLAGFFSETSIQSLQVYWPFVIPYGIAFFYILVDRLDLGVRLYNLWLKILIVVLTFIPMFLTLAPPNNVLTYPPYHASLIGRVGAMLNEREVLCTDMPWATAWYGDRYSILVPKNLEQFYEINDYKQYISGLYFTTITRNKPFVKQLLDGPEQSWLPIMSGRTPPDFPLKEIVALNRQDQIFLSDRDRWSVKAAEQ